MPSLRVGHCRADRELEGVTVASLLSMATADELALPVMRAKVRSKQQRVVGIVMATERRIAAAAAVELQAGRVRPRR